MDTDIHDLDNISKGDLIRLSLKIIWQTIASRGRNFIYVPRRYDSNPEYEKWKDSVERISYRVNNLQMSAFLDCDPEKPPERFWLMFGGNASVALDWLPVTTFAPPSTDAFILFDYPGFGDCDGRPTRALIRSCIDELVENINSRFSIDPIDIAERFHVIGHSLGAAVALDTAARYSIKKGICVSPFTSIHEIGEHMFGKFLPYFAADRYNNRKSIQDIIKSVESLKLHVVHGAKDEIIPIHMARELHNESPGHINLWEIPDANHNDILLLLSREIGRALTNGGEFCYDG